MAMPHWHAPENVDKLITFIPDGLQRYRPSLHYLLLDEGRYTEHELAELQSLTAEFFSVGKWPHCASCRTGSKGADCLA